MHRAITGSAMATAWTPIHPEAWLIKVGHYRPE
jgi:hypothetical protein